MIHLLCKSEAYTYNVYHIIKAFFPSEEVITSVDEEASCYVEVCLPDEGGRLAVDEEQLADAMRQRGAAPKEQKELKYWIDVCLYRRLLKLTGRSLAWGILTGVRPTKIAMQRAEEGWDRDRFVPWFQEECMVSGRKAELAWEIAKREQAMLGRLDYEEGYSLYVGIPFCPSVCTYCSFSSGALSDWKDRVGEYLEALQKELVFIAKRSRDRKLNTVYIGGGTPTTLTADQLDGLLTCIDAHFSREYLLEYTVEAGRPDSITAEKLKVLKRHGITRISINPQSMQQKTLDMIGRKHRVEEIAAAYRMARELGFGNINMDLIVGLPGETVDDVRNTMEEVAKLSPDNLTVHSLALKRAARLKMFPENFQGMKMENTWEIIALTAEYARNMNLLPYYLYRQKNMAGNFENVGYASPGKAGLYNILIMEEVQSIVALGAGSISKRVEPGRKIERSENVKDVSQYIERIGEMIERKRVLLEE